MHNETYKITLKAKSHGTIHFDNTTNRVIEVMFSNWHLFEQTSRVNKHNYYTYSFVSNIPRSKDT